MPLSSRNKKIIVVGIIYIGILASVIGWNWIQYQNRLQLSPCEDESWCVRVYGNVKEELSIGISYLTNNETFDYIPDTYFNMSNSWGTQYRRIYSGISVADILQSTQIIGPDAKYIQFESNDGFSSFLLPLQVVLENPQSVLLVHREGRQEIESKENGGDGPIMSFVALDILQNNTEILLIFQENGQDFAYNSVYNVKYCNSIKII